MRTLIMKFGGTSVGSAEALTQVAEIVLQQSKDRDWGRTVVVVSAMSGVTDALARGAMTAAAGDDRTYRTIASDLLDRQIRTVEALLPKGGAQTRLLAILDTYLEEFTSFCHSVHILGEVTARAMAGITALGEQISAHILAALLCRREFHAQAVDAAALIVTDEAFQNAVPLMAATRTRVSARLVPLLEQGLVPVVTGFIGATAEGVTTTLGRGGSDYTAAILGDCLDAAEVWTFTDVDGVLTADPGIVPDARVIPLLSYSEVGELAYFGAKVLHPRAIRPVIERGIPLLVKNTSPSSIYLLSKTGLTV